MINIYELKLTNLQQRIIRLLCVRAGKQFNALALAKSLKVSQPAVSKAIPYLEKLGMIKSEKDKESGRFSIELNRDNHKVVQLKRADNLKVIYESGLADFLEKEFAGATIIIFGSYSNGTDIYNSDMDIAVIGRKDKQINLETFEKILEKKVNINFYKSFKEIHQHLKENLFNGIVLSGGVEL